MRGINRSIIEITDTDSEMIEKVLVFVKPNAGNIKLTTQKQEAQKYVSGLVCVRRRPWLSNKMYIILSAIIGIAVIAIILLNIFL